MSLPWKSAMVPAMAVLTVAPNAPSRPKVPRHRLKRLVPRVRSAEISGSITPKPAALMPSSPWTRISGSGSPTRASSTARAGTAMKHRISTGRRPIRSAQLPTAGAKRATINCGSTMQAAMIRLAMRPERAVTSPATSGSWAALARWNSTTARPKISSLRSVSRRQTSARAAFGAGGPVGAAPLAVGGGGIAAATAGAVAGAVAGGGGGTWRGADGSLMVVSTIRLGNISAAVR